MNNIYKRALIIPMAIMITIATAKAENTQNINDNISTRVVPADIQEAFQREVDANEPITVPDENDFPIEFPEPAEPAIDMSDDSPTFPTTLNNDPLGIASTNESANTTRVAHAFSHAVLTLPDNPRMTGAWTKTITNQEDWEAFFYAQTAHIFYGDGGAPVAIEIDFERYQVFTGGLGVKSGGYSLVIESVVESDVAVVLNALEIRPSENCVQLLLAGESYPSTTILINKTDKPFEIHVAQLVDECSN